MTGRKTPRPGPHALARALPHLFLSAALLLGLAAGNPACAQGGPASSLRLNGMLSAGFSHNFNRPSTQSNQLRVFDQDDDSFTLDVLELVIQKDAAERGEAGFRADLTAGASISRVTASRGLFRDEAGQGQDVDLHQAYFSYVLPWGNKIRLDLGKQVTHLGYEVIEGYDGLNDSASRSFLFGYAIPFTQTGLRAGLPFSSRLGAAFFVVNGWDNVRDNNRAKSFGAQLSWSPVGALTLTGNYLGGAEQDSSNSNLRHTADLVCLFRPAGPLSLGLNAGYGREANVPMPAGISGPAGSPTPTGAMKTVSWWGTALYARVQLKANFALCGRAELFDDRDGVRTGQPGSRQILREATLTPELRLTPSFLLRSDLRYDHSGSAVFLDRHGKGMHGQPTLSLNAVYTF